MEQIRWMFNASMEQKHVTVGDTEHAPYFVKTMIISMVCVLLMHVVVIFKIKIWVQDELT